MAEETITCKLAETEADFTRAKILFREYADALGVDLSFQDFEKELKPFLSNIMNLRVVCSWLISTTRRSPARASGTQPKSGTR